MKYLVSQSNKLLLDRYRKIKPTQKDNKCRLRWINLIKSEILKIYPTSSVKLFGSFYTGLYISSSDIDISINIETDDPNTILKAVKFQLYQTNQFHSLLHLSHAKIPILKFKAKKFGFKFDISVNNVSGISTGKYVKKKIEGDPNLMIFAILFKHFINSRKLGDASVGGLNSYSQFLMILIFVEMNPFYQEKNLAVTFFDFVQFLGYDFKYKNVQIDIKNCIFTKNVYNRLSIIDPTDNLTDVGACCKNMEKVIETLQNFYRSILFHFNKNSIVDLFDEMFFLSSEEIEQRKYVNENYNKKFTIQKKKISNKMSLRDANLHIKNVKRKEDTISCEKLVDDLFIERKTVKKSSKKKRKKNSK